MKKLFTTLLSILTIISVSSCNKQEVTYSFESGVYINHINDESFYTLLVEEIDENTYSNNDSINTVKDETNGKYFSLSLEKKEHLVMESAPEFSLGDFVLIDGKTFTYSDENNNTLSTHTKDNETKYIIKCDNITLEFNKHTNHTYINCDFDKKNNEIYHDCLYCEEKKIETYNQLTYSKIRFTSPTGGCIVFEYSDIIKKHTEYDLFYAKKVLSCEKFIDLESLTIYTDTIKVNDNMLLYAYNDKLLDSQILTYLFNNGNFEFERCRLTDETLQEYSYTTLENDNVYLKIDDVEYIFTDSSELSGKYLISIKSNKPLFNKKLKETKEILKVLFGSEDYSSRYISVQINEDGYVINFKEMPIIG